MNKRFLLLWLISIPSALLAQESKVDSTKSWRFSAWAEVFVLPGEQDYFNPTFYARHKNLHLEGRYNYEDFQTTSLWAGRRFETGNEVKFVFVPMAGVVFGNTNGMAPGLEMEIIYGKFDLYSESEHVFDFNSKENNFFYQYGEFAMRPIKPLRTGLIVQRTKLFETERELNRGLFTEYYWKQLRAGVFYFNPFSDDQFAILSLSFDF